MAAGTNMPMHDHSEARRQRTTISKGNQSTVPLHKAITTTWEKGEIPQRRHTRKGMTSAGVTMPIGNPSNASFGCSYPPIPHALG